MHAMQILVEKSLIETVGLEWAEGSSGTSPAPAAATSHMYS